MKKKIRKNTGKIINTARQTARYLLTMFLLAFLLLGLPETADAGTASGTCGTNVNWSYAGGTLTISGSGAMKDYKCVDDDSGMHTNAPWYAYAGTCKKVVIKDGVTAIGENAFYEFKKMTGLTLGNSVQKIGECAFFSCRISSVKFPTSLKTIGDSAFDGNSFKEVDLPKSVEKVAGFAFEDCANLKKVVVRNKSMKYGKAVFAYTGSALVLYGYDNSTSEAYAKKWTLGFSSLSEGSGFHFINLRKSVKYPYGANNYGKISTKYFWADGNYLQNNKMQIAVADNLNGVTVALYDRNLKQTASRNDQYGAQELSFGKLKNNTVYYYRIRKDTKSENNKVGKWSAYKAFVTAGYKYSLKANNSILINTPKVSGIKSYTVYISKTKTSGYKKVKAVNPGKKVTITKYGSRKLAKDTNYYIKIVPKTTRGVTYDAAVSHCRTKK